MINVGIIGYGYWGPNLVRNFAESPGCRIAAVSDLNAGRLQNVKRRYPSIEVSTDYKDLLENNGIDAIAIATPVSTHFELAMQSLKAGKHVLVEKPLASRSEECFNLIEEAARLQKTLLVDHTFVYTGAVRKIRELIENNELGGIYYYDSVRINLGLFQHDVNVVWDLAVHDLSIMDFLFEVYPCAVSATGMSHLNRQPENIAYMTLFFDRPFIAHVHVSWLAPVKIRRALIGGSAKMVVFDDLESSEKVKVYDKGITTNDDIENMYKMLVGYRVGDMWAPNLDQTEALRTEVAHFIDCIENSRRPITDGESGSRVVSILEAAVESMTKRGTPVQLESPWSKK